MYLRNIEGAARGADTQRMAANATTAQNTPQSTAARGSTAPAIAAPSSRGAFFDMMLTAQSSLSAPAPAGGPAVRAATATPLSVGENSTGVRGSSQAVTPPVTAVRNSPGSASTTATQPLDTAPTPESAPPPPPSSDNPVDVINGLLTKLGYDASTFQARVTSSQISYPGMSYAYPLLEVTVNGERVGFHLPSAMRDPRVTAANISSMLGRPLLNFGVFA